MPPLYLHYASSSFFLSMLSSFSFIISPLMRLPDDYFEVAFMSAFAMPLLPLAAYAMPPLPCVAAEPSPSRDDDAAPCCFIITQKLMILSYISPCRLIIDFFFFIITLLLYASPLMPPWCLFIADTRFILRQRHAWCRCRHDADMAMPFRLLFSPPRYGMFSFADAILMRATALCCCHCLFTRHAAYCCRLRPVDADAAVAIDAPPCCRQRYAADAVVDDAAIRFIDDLQLISLRRRLCCWCFASAIRFFHFRYFSPLFRYAAISIDAACFFRAIFSSDIFAWFSLSLSFHFFATFSLISFLFSILHVYLIFAPPLAAMSMLPRHISLQYYYLHYFLRHFASRRQPASPCDAAYIIFFFRFFALFSLIFRFRYISSR